MKAFTVSNNLKPIILCADDYGQNQFINEGIIQLIHKKRINAVSCIANGSQWGESHQALLSCDAPDLMIGLHLNFTQGNPLSAEWRALLGNSFPSLSTLLKKIYLRTLPQTAIEAEIEAQKEAFTQTIKRAPDFIDGHQHVHQLPGIREILLELYRRKQWHGWIRNTSNGIHDFLTIRGFPKRQIIPLLGGITLKKRLKQYHIQTNTSFAGIRQYSHLPNIRFAFNEFFRMTRPGGLIMCHPGIPSKHASDPMATQRADELSYLLSDAFLEDMHLFGLNLENQ